MGDPK